MPSIFTHLFFLYTIQTLLVKSVLFYDFNNIQLHILHAFLHFSYLIFILIEIFVFKVFYISLTTILQLCLSGNILFIF